MFWKKCWVCGGNCNLPHKTLKFKVSVYSSMLAFCWFWHKTQTYWSNQFWICKRFGQKSVLEEKLSFVEIAIWRTDAKFSVSCLCLQLWKYCYVVFRELTSAAEKLLSVLNKLYGKRVNLQPKLKFLHNSSRKKWSLKVFYFSRCRWYEI